MPVTYALYFGYMGLIALGVFLITGTIGFFSRSGVLRTDGCLSHALALLARRGVPHTSPSPLFLSSVVTVSLYFNYQIYASIKVD
jgi:hypothetical protein